MPCCPECGDERSTRNDVLQCIVVNHGADMRLWQAFRRQQGDTSA